MKFKRFLELYDNWNGKTRVNDNELNVITEDKTIDIYQKRKDLHRRNVIAFGFIENVLTVRVK